MTALLLATLTGCISAKSLVKDVVGDLTPTQETLVYEKMASKANKTTTVGGVVLKQPSGGNWSIGKLSGTLKHDTGELSTNDESYQFTGVDGMNAQGQISDGNGSNVTITPIAGYEYVASYDQTYTHNGQTYDNSGTIGIITEAHDMPSGGKATYRGMSTASLQGDVTNSKIVNMKDGQSLVEADFGAGKVDVTMSNFQSVVELDGNNNETPTTAPIDRILITDMDISGNRFSGGTTELQSHGNRVAFGTVTGANTNVQSEGAFFGYNNDRKALDEVAGGVYAKGDTGQVIGTFVGNIQTPVQ